jgi:hypothetical protein
LPPTSVHLVQHIHRNSLFILAFTSILINEVTKRE